MLTRRALLAGLAAVPVRRPNFVFILVDDLRWDELGCTGHPFAQTPHTDRLAREGANFANAFATTPLCSPSRACFLTGQYAHRHGITDNTDRSRQSHALVTFPRLLHDAGYRTGFVGKWHMGVDDTPRPGFDHWVSFPGQGESVDPVLNVNGTARKTSGYITDVLTHSSLEFLAGDEGRPFCLYLSHKAIHPNIQQRADSSVSRFEEAEDFIYAPRHRGLYAGEKLPRRANYAQAPAGKPALQRQIGTLPPLGPATVSSDELIRNRMRMMKAIDESTGRIVAQLHGTNRLDDTVIVFTSDHGYFYGEHGLSRERRLAYEEAIRIPLIVRYPRKVRAGLRPAHLALSIDIAPTFLDLAGLTPPRQMQGCSLVPLLEGRRPRWRQDFPIEYYSDTVFPRMHKMGYRAVRSHDWKYIRYSDLEGMDELYNLRVDPFELRNLIAEPSAAAPLAAARRRLQDLVRHPDRP